MRIQQQMAPEKSKPGRRTNLKLRHVLFSMIALLLCVASIVWILSIGRVISGTWAVVLPVVLVVNAVFVKGCASGAGNCIGPTIYRQDNIQHPGQPQGLPLLYTISAHAAAKNGYYPLRPLSAPSAH